MFETSPWTAVLRSKGPEAPWINCGLARNTEDQKGDTVFSGFFIEPSP